MKNILITGANGFIGRHLSRFFAGYNWHVTGIGYGRFTPREQRQWGIRNWHSGAISFRVLSKAVRKRPDLIIHCAGGNSVGRSRQDPGADFRDTVGTTSAVLRYMRRQRFPGRLIFISSAAVYGETRRMSITENAALNPISPYGEHKKIAEEFCIEDAGKFNFSLAIIRFFSVYGDGLKKQLLWEALRKIDLNDFRFFGTGDEKRDWLHIDDAVDLVYKTGIAGTLRHRIINGGSGSGLSVKQALKHLFRFYGAGGEPKFSGKINAGNPACYIADITRARSLGWRPLVRWDDGLARYVNWYRGLKHD